VPLPDALAQGDVISLHASGDTPVPDAPAFAQTRDGTIILNDSRGGCVDEAELAEGLASGKIAGAWVDTFEQEPYVGPLCDAPNAPVLACEGAVPSSTPPHLRPRLDAIAALHADGDMKTLGTALYGSTDSTCSAARKATNSLPCLGPSPASSPLGLAMSTMTLGCR
jgi:hypothetical protein